METESRPRQKIQDGYGPLFHRTYIIALNPCSFEKASKAFEKLKADPNEFSPQLLARFEKTKGAPGKLARDDEFMIHITGPWNGPVRVAEVTDRSFKLVTLEDHLESGDIEFSIKEEKDHIVFRIESFARSRDRLVDVVYDKVPIARKAQTEMWTQVCTGFLKCALGDDCEPAEVRITTKRRDEETGEWEQI